ncbi:hypothetical protein VIAG107301_14325 [Vibrio agarivorans]
MRYSPLAVHCTSLCFDVIQSQYFDDMTAEDIKQSKEDIYLLLKSRTYMLPYQHWREDMFLNMVANSVIEVLYQCRNHRSKRDAQWILCFVERQIDFAIERARN